MNFNLTPQLEKLVQDKIASGKYNSASEFNREALQLMEQRNEIRAVQLQELRNRMDKGLAEADHGEGTNGEVFMNEMLENLKNRHPSRESE